MTIKVLKVGHDNSRSGSKKTTIEKVTESYFFNELPCHFSLLKFLSRSSYSCQILLVGTGIRSTICYHTRKPVFPFPLTLGLTPDKRLRMALLL